MQCREGCGACCIAPSISSAIPGMPQGKPAGVPCIHLTAEYRCAIFADPRRPPVCAGFTAESVSCGSSREDALQILTWWEEATA
ncbi:YkgJ family cysteine cluster protein [Halopseudomonas phragmitis]|uniref:YkgJ family cysteine cluster protein n=2 Tax=Pseudomonadaceae TaxID=135621 RepID=A0A1V0B8B1_9GAMM|nr:MULTISPECIES: YkgJ family cysteine cluster protein [Pseudomonadaceae]AQZ96130.1 hypothetical protein BVH74_15815 [Halopseudomonas phragmitis]RHW20968.1 hypothetical protein C2846_11395 [Pseudomonas jilinensis]